LRHRSIHRHFVSLLVMSLVLLLLGQRYKAFRQAQNRLNHLFVVPLEQLMDWPMQQYQRLQASFTAKQQLWRRNHHLQQQVTRLQGRLQQMRVLRQQNQQLTALLQAKPKPLDRVLVAHLLAITPDPFVQQVLINRGEADHVYQGQPVLSRRGVFGQVVHCSQHTSKVMLITDTRSAVPVKDVRSGVQGIVVGQGDTQALALINMPATADIKQGDKLVTSGLGQRFPRGYPVGTVQRKTINSAKKFADITVHPKAQLRQIYFVLLIWPYESSPTQGAQT
jgi:rod shape-determining protein MreC